MKRPESRRNVDDERCQHCVRKFPKKLGVTAQREIENGVHELRDRRGRCPAELAGAAGAGEPDRGCNRGAMAMLAKRRKKQISRRCPYWTSRGPCSRCSKRSTSVRIIALCASEKAASDHPTCSAAASYISKALSHI
jgi:Family of unknown function (DUF6494)